MNSLNDSASGIDTSRWSKTGVFIIAEVAQAHDGSLGMAHAYIDAIANAGADAVKFQTHIAAAESTSDEPWRLKFSVQDATRYDYWKRMEFTEEQWHGLKRHADERGLKFLSSPFSIEAVELLTRVGVAAWKVASGEISNTPMFEQMIATGLPILLSTGMSPLTEIDAAVERVKASGLPLTVLQCTSAYPCPPEKIGLNLIPFFRERYGCNIGLSDHSGTIYPGLAAATLGIEVLEVHVTLSREMFGPDVSASITTADLRQMVGGIRFIENMRANPVDKDEMADEMAPLRDLFTKSVVARVDLPAGSVLQNEHLTVKKPGTGIPASRISELVGQTLRSSVKASQVLQESDVARKSSSRIASETNDLVVYDQRSAIAQTAQRRSVKIPDSGGRSQYGGDLHSGRRAWERRKARKRNIRRWGWALLILFAFVTGFAFFAYEPGQTCIHFPEGLVRWWPLDESRDSRTVSDTVGANAGTANGVRFGQPGKVKTAALFDGVGDFIASDLPDQIFTQYTVDLWVKALAVGQPNFSAVLNNFNNEGGAPVAGTFQIDVDGGNPGNYRMFFDSHGILFGPVTTDWQHLAATYDGTTVKTYVNGRLRSTLKLAPAQSGANFRDLILGRNRAGNRYFKGLIDEVQIYNRALSPKEINTLFLVGSQAKSTCAS